MVSPLTKSLVKRYRQKKNKPKITLSVLDFVPLYNYFPGEGLRPTYTKLKFIVVYILYSIPL